MDNRPYFIDSIYIPYGTKIACVRMFPMNKDGSEGRGKEIKTTTDKLVLNGWKRKRILEGEFYYYDPSAEKPFTDASNDPLVRKQMDAYFAMIKSIEENNLIRSGEDNI